MGKCFLREFPTIALEPHSDWRSTYRQYTDPTTVWSSVLAPVQQPIAKPLRRWPGYSKGALNRNGCIWMFGDGAVGKTALATRFLQDLFMEEYDSAVETTYIKCVQLATDARDSEMRVTVLDTTGQREPDPYAHLWQCADELTAVALVIDITYAPSLRYIRELIPRLLLHKPAWGALGQRPIMLMLNKTDVDIERQQVRDGEVWALAKQWPCHYARTSAKTGVGVQDAFRLLLLMGMYAAECPAPSSAPGIKRKPKCAIM